MTGHADRTPEQIERARDRSRAWHARQRELAALALAVDDQRDQTSGQRPDSASGSLPQHPDHASGLPEPHPDYASGPPQPHPDAERLAELERRLVELEVRAAAYEAELMELRAYRQRNRDRSRRNALDRRQVKDTGTVIARTGTLPASTGTPAGGTAANAARASRAPARSGFSGRVNNSAGGGVSRARSAPPPPPPPPAALPTDDDDGTVLDRLWSEPRIKTVIEQRGLNPAWERANFVRKPQGHDPRNWTVEYLEAWLLRSTVQVPDPTPITRAATDRAPRQDQRVAPACASTAYVHDPWAGRRPPIAEADLVRGGGL